MKTINEKEYQDWKDAQTDGLSGRGTKVLIKLASFLFTQKGK